MWNFVITATSNLNILQKPWHFYSFVMLHVALYLTVNRYYDKQNVLTLWHCN